MSTSEELLMPKAKIQRHEIEAWLGDGWTPSQLGEVVKRIEKWEYTHPNAEEIERTAAWEAISTHADFRLDLTEVADGYQQARELEGIRRTQLRAAVWVLCRYGGLTETEAARVTGMHRNTIHAWVTE